ncbi:type II toxin-antitoxin system RelE/ParE family toxin [Nibricoccus sp. IMCC34717]|uniref:type II toxin-antitoxin system RelE/ParE family toxin n=1 Tax=Nibricoccus sp. IMCC34717 TaxID=3034021 RepID=UPI00384FCBF2
MKLWFSTAATRDIAEGANFYDSIQEGVGDYFEDSALAEIESLILYAGIHRMVYDHHRLLMRRFPFAIYYKVIGDEVQIWRVLDCRKDPDWIRREVRKAKR